ncbi:polysaccharide deacetylase family protein [Haloarcula salinisoli]|uniref:Polysaccharide deacetylase family protein n=1 Tax=Haloarcula salinisoli TaxID=2487746 RepID=A0A8J8C8K3_9EURY|nr:polysaccharide deacetylase family protein [Halomicroarcula salinisoli]MBX0287205.1 polysaccharide deacetylase family protein [Halomicroarcula salinisoli]MBX0304511.1 polysaccharide deacetylase family protein [Halomicroarcula salinisoli]
MSDTVGRAVLSIDVELFDQTPAYRSASGITDQQGIGLNGLAWFRETLGDRGASTTCFVVSSLVDRYPEAIEALADAGFEIASHTHSHELLSDRSADERREELATSKERLESLTGQSVTGFRAPAFDITDDHFDLLAETGYEYDSSVVASRAIPGWYGGEYDLETPALATAVDPDAPAGLAELPASVMPGLRLPLTGTWLRFFGPRYTALGMRLLARRGITPVLYVHPWELVGLPQVEGVPARVYYHTGEWMREALTYILDQPFDFVTARSVLEDAVPGWTDQNRPADGPQEE